MTDLAAIHADLAAGGRIVYLAAWASAAGISYSKLAEHRRHDPALRALPVAPRGRPRK